MSQSLPRSTPKAQGVSSSALLGFLAAVRDAGLELHSLMVLRHGHVVAEGWWQPYQAHVPHMLFSLSKSFTSSAIGCLVDDGKLSLDEPVISLFPTDLPPEISPNLRSMRVRHLLTMTTGHAEDTDNSAVHGSENWVKTILEQSIVYAPGSHFRYNGGATFLLSAIVQRISGLRLLEFLRPRLLEPLGISAALWASNAQGIDYGAFGLSLTTEDIAKFGQLYLQRGVWNGQRLLSESWVAQATANQLEPAVAASNDWAQGYGFQFWRCRHGAYRGDGAFGQFCIVLPDLDAVVAITAEVMAMQPVLDLVWTHLHPGLHAAPLSADKPHRAQLLETLESLTLPESAGERSSSLESLIASQWYDFEPNDAKLERVRFRFAGDTCEIWLQTDSGEHHLHCGVKHWVIQQTNFEHRSGFDNLELHLLIDQSLYLLSAQCAWTRPDALELRLCYTESPFQFTLLFEFSDRTETLRLSSSINISFEATEFPLIHANARRD